MNPSFLLTFVILVQDPSRTAALSFRYLFQVIKLHGDLSEKEVDVRAPLHSTDEERLCIGQKKKKKKCR